MTISTAIAPTKFAMSFSELLGPTHRPTTMASALSDLSQTRFERLLAAAAPSRAAVEDDAGSDKTFIDHSVDEPREYTEDHCRSPRMEHGREDSALNTDFWKYVPQHGEEARVTCPVGSVGLLVMSPV